MWDVSLDGQLAAGTQLYLETPDGVTVASVSPDNFGHAELDDLLLPAGEHILAIYPSSAISSPYALTATQAVLGSADPEPNGDPTTPCGLDPDTWWSTAARRPVT